MKTNTNPDFDDLSLEELIDLLIEKTSELLQARETNMGGVEFQNLLLQVEQLNIAIKNKREA
jgi:hypothetical protein